ncbi:transposase [Nocardia sp. NPDC050630]|uniref:transposase n=1 Tax=Nocardia sp. NPDC050630 TaxID=3364321 RepID=UPI0037B1ADD7
MFPSRSRKPGAVAASRDAPRTVDRGHDLPDPADPSLVGVRVARSARDCASAVPLAQLGGGAAGDLRPRRRGSGPHSPPRPGPVRADGPSRDHPRRWTETVPADLRETVCGAERFGWCARPPARRSRTRAPTARRLDRPQAMPGRHRSAHDRSARWARADRSRRLHRRAVSGRGRGDPGRNRRPCKVFTVRAVVKHAGLAPREKLSGTFTGRTRLTGRGRPGIRLAAWRAVFAARHANPVYAARYQHLTCRDTNKLTPGQAQAAIAAAILRHLHAVIRTRQPWDLHIATYGTTKAPTTVSTAV